MPHEGPKVIAITAKAFAEVQRRRSAMERELYALWQGILSQDHLIRGFNMFVYIDYQNNLFSEAQLDNRRRSNKMPNWALDLQWYDLVQV